MSDEPENRDQNGDQSLSKPDKTTTQDSGTSTSHKRKISTETSHRIKRPNHNQLDTQNRDPSDDTSREQTPEVINDALFINSDSAAASPGSANHEDESRNQKEDSPSTKADEQSTENHENHETNEAVAPNVLATFETRSKRITARSIEKHWVPLDSESFNSFENICAISMNSVMEMYEKSDRSSLKVAETQRILSNRWLSQRLPKSFLSRLKVTKLPPAKSLVVKMRGIKDAKFDPLSIDQVSLRRRVFETYLSAEKKQLESLEAYKSSLQKTYDSDLDYLNDFRKTTASIRAKNSQEKAKIVKELHLDLDTSSTETQPTEQRSIKLKPSVRNTALSANAKFDPLQDNDLKPLLVDISNEVSKLDPHRSEILDLCDKLDIIERQLYTQRSE